MSKEKKAVALKYIKEKEVPVVVAKGEGYIAEKIVERANEENIRIHKDKDILDSLMNLEIGEEIPPELYEAVAEIIAFVYYLNREKGDIDG